MDFTIELINRPDQWFIDTIEQIKKSDMPREQQFDLIDVLRSVANQCQQAREMGWL